MTSRSQPPLEEGSRPVCTLLELGKQFLRLGCIGFGGPLAHTALLQQEMVQKRQWVTPEQFLEGFTLSQVFPGPLSTQVAIYIGYRIHQVRGALIAGCAFILPAFLLMISLTWIYFRFGMVPAVQGLFYGMTPAVLAMIALSGYSLSKTAATDWILRFIAAASTIGVAFFSINIVLLFALAGLLTVVLSGPGSTASSQRFAALVPLPLLGQLAWYFLKVGSLIFGGGMVIVPMLEQEVVNRLGWLTHREFLDGLALGQVTPGPVVITAAFIGFKVAGFLGALVATVAIFFPSFVFVFIGAALMKRWERSPRMQAALRGINAAAVGAILGACYPLSRAALTGALPALLFAISLVAMWRYRVGFLKVLGAGALLGLLARSLPIQ
ncbi:MAG: chromate efflux transporter [Acidobacteria bacterium]|nr:chromate efflux transporter [Acidobacteriota bacterium]